MRSHRLVGFFAASSMAAAALVSACVGDDLPSDPGTAPGVDDGGPGQSSESGTSNDGGPGERSSIDGGIDGAVSTLDVRTLPGLRLWLESTQDLTKAATGNDLVSWRDSSGRWADGGAGGPDGGERHTAYPVSFSGGGGLYPAVILNGVAGRPSVSFESGHKLTIANHADFDVGTGDFVIAAVASITTGTGPFWNLTTMSTAASGTWLGSMNACSFLGGFNAPKKCTSPDYSPNTSPHVFIVRRKAAQAIYRVDATTRGTYDFGVDNTNLGVQTFQQPNAVIGPNIVAQLSEVLVIVGATNDAAFDTLEAHLKTKYAIP